jgi:hypothetical protein
LWRRLFALAAGGHRRYTAADRERSLAMTEQPTLPAAATAGQPAGQPMAIEIPPNLDAIYTNFALITHSPSEVLIDFARVLPNMHARVQVRLVMTPLNAKLLLHALTENLSKFEAQFGEIVVPTHLADHLFKPPRPE